VQDKLEELCTNKHAHRVLMQLLCPDSHRYLPPATYELLHPPPKTMMVPAAAAAAGTRPLAGDGDDEEPDGADDGADGAGAHAGGSEHQQTASSSEQGGGSDDPGSEAGEQGELRQQEEEAGACAGAGSAKLVPRTLGESKKAADVRRRELLGSGRSSLSGGVVQLCALQASELLQSPVGSEVLVEVARGAAGGLLWQLQQEGVQAVHAALVQRVQADVSGVQQEGSEPLLTHYYGSRGLRRLLLAGEAAGADGEEARAFAQQLWSDALQGHCQQLVGSHADKVLAALLHCGVPSVVQAAAADLQALVGGNAQAWAATFMGPAGGACQQHVKGCKQQQRQQTDKQQKVQASRWKHK
jgi:pumilio family protein 6